MEASRTVARPMQPRQCAPTLRPVAEDVLRMPWTEARRNLIDDAIDKLMMLDGPVPFELLARYLPPGAQVAYRFALRGYRAQRRQVSAEDGTVEVALKRAPDSADSRDSDEGSVDLKKNPF